MNPELQSLYKAISDNQFPMTITLTGPELKDGYY